MPGKIDRSMTCTECGIRIDVSMRNPGERISCACGKPLYVPEPAKAATSLSCPGCGSPCDRDLHRCPYCGAGLQTVSCPKCFGMNFKGVKHCCHCGEKIERAAVDLDEESGLPCPRCGAGLARRHDAGCLLNACSTCGGVWVDSETLDRLVSGKDGAAAVRKAALPFEESARGGVSEDKVAYIPCPSCGTMMHRRNFGKASGVIVDVCKEHGTWFDRGEIRHCVEFVLSGGLEKAARIQKEELKNEVEHLKSMARGIGTGASYTVRGARKDSVFELAGEAGFVLGLIRIVFRLLG